ncbi:MAG TPA: metal ABC transporter ATP-binding protein [Planctomycetota bacterium]|nr:metal ABC transporter ATP-binding protein [Planctomycetota bacterium]
MPSGTISHGAACVLGHAIEIEGVSVRLDGVNILENVNAGVPMGKLSALIGPNGAGKTTLLMTMLGLLPHQGAVRFCGCGPHGSGVPRVGYVPQRLDFDRAAPISVLDFMCVAIQGRPLFLGRRRSLSRRGREALARVGAEKLAERPLGRLSGGELQRVLLAQVLLEDPHVILLDEPVSGVDAAGEQLFLDLVREITAPGERTVLMVSHDISVVAERAEHVIALNRSVVAQGPPREVLSTEVLLELFGVRVHHLGACADRDHGSAAPAKPCSCGHDHSAEGKQP